VLFQLTKTETEMSVNGIRSIPLTETEIETEIHAKTENKRKRKYRKRKLIKNGNT